VTAGALDEIEAALGPDAEALQEYFLMARRGMRRVLRVAERLHRTAQLEGSKVEWAKVPLDLRSLAEEAAKDTQSLEARRAVRVNLSCSEAACPIEADRDWMHAAIGELVGNAIRFARSLVTVHTEALADGARVTITDDGPGFAGPPLLRFDPPPEKRGVGLSLALVRDVVASHGGRLEIEDSPASSSSGGHLVLVLPLRPASAP
jgi:signal transduction histidine kinase